MAQRKVQGITKVRGLRPWGTVKVCKTFHLSNRYFKNVSLDQSSGTTNLSTVQTLTWIRDRLLALINMF